MSNTRYSQKENGRNSFLRYLEQPISLGFYLIAEDVPI